MRGEAERSFEYRNDRDELLGYVCAWHSSKGALVRYSLTWCTNAAGEGKWDFLQFPRLLPLYNWHRIASQEAEDASGVIVVFDEVQAELVSKYFPSWIPTTWPSGPKAVEFVNWEPLRNKLVVIWPPHGAEHDDQSNAPMPRERQPYVRAANRIAELLRERGVPHPRIIDSGEPSLHADGWSITDMEREGWSADRIYSWYAERFVQVNGQGVGPPGKDAGEPPHGAGGDGQGEEPDDGRPRIRWMEGELPRVLDQARTRCSSTRSEPGGCCSSAPAEHGGARAEA
jgi:hypothetical protein